MKPKIRRRWLVAISLLLLLLVPVALLMNRPAENVYHGLQGLTLEEVEARFADQQSDTPRIGIAFGGGGVRGFLHLGVIRALEEAGIRADVVTGTSAGSIAALLYASVPDYADIESITLAVKEIDLADPVISMDGVLAGKKVAQWVNGWSSFDDISEAPIRVGITVTDVTNRRAVILLSGQPGEAAQASSTVPGAFVPVQSGNITYIDGGVLALVPVRFARAMGADIVIAVDIYCGGPLPAELDAVSTMYATFHLQSCALADQELEDADYVIRPVVDASSIGTFQSRDSSIEAGYRAAKRVVADLVTDLQNR